MNRWRLIDHGAAEGAWNMALDDALFREAESGRVAGPAVRLYAWSPPCLSLGFHQSLPEACDEGFCRSAGVDVVRRPTGGKAVLHADEVTYSVTSPSDAWPFRGLDLRGTYQVIAGALLSALRQLGLPASLEERSTPLSPTGGQPCFVAASQMEVLVGRRKVTGSAQRRGQRAFLQHGAIPLHIDYRLLAGATRSDPGQAGRFRDSFAGVADLLPGIEPADLRAALVEGFTRAFGEAREDERPSPAEEAEARRLLGVRYATRRWTEAGKDLEEDALPKVRPGPDRNSVSQDREFGRPIVTSGRRTC